MQIRILSLALGLNLAVAANAMAASFSQVYQDYLASQQTQNTTQTLALAKQAAELGQQKFGETTINSINLQYNLAAAYAAAKQHQLAFETMHKVTAGFKAHYGEHSEQLLGALLEQIGYFPSTLGSNISKQKQQLKPIAKQAVEVTEALAKRSSKKAPFYYYQLSKAITQHPVVFHVRRDAIKATELAYSGLLASIGNNDLRTLEMQFTLATIKTGLKKTNQAIDLYENLISTIEAQLDTSHPYELSARSRLVQLYEAKGQSEKATEHCIQIGQMTPWQDELEPMPLYRIEPKYPMSAARNSREGYAKMSFSIDEMGFVKDITLQEVKGGKDFGKVSIQALEKWRYAPRFENGKAIKAKNLEVQLDFKLSKS
ncbi:TonB family protein [Paraglaciecola aestuariivivens]